MMNHAPICPEVSEKERKPTPGGSQWSNEERGRRSFRSSLQPVRDARVAVYLLPPLWGSFGHLAKHTHDERVQKGRKICQ